MLEHPYHTGRRRSVVEQEAHLDDAEHTSRDERVAEQCVDLATSVNAPSRRVVPLTFEEIMRACSCALIPQPVMMILRLQHDSMGVKQDRASTYITAGTNDLLPFLLRKIPSIPPAHHSTPCGCQCPPPACLNPGWHLCTLTIMVCCISLCVHGPP